jgi:hypothetical protein
LPVLGVDVGGVGVVAPSGDARYVTLPAGRDTVVARVNPRSGRILASTLVPGAYTIPAVAYDGSASGLSSDGRTLALIQPRVSFPRAQTALMIVEAGRLRPRKLVRLRGDFSFDAISPGGSLLYLIQYVSPTDPTRYLVRTYDLRAGRLLATPVTDPRERGEKMRGSPLTRASSLDGRWAYTLYDGAGQTPFIHALDTQARSARCVDLDTLAGTDLSRLRLHLSEAASTLTVSDGRQPVVIVDTRTFRTSTPRESLSTPSGPGARRHATGLPWALVALSSVGALGAAGALSLALRRRRQRLALVTAVSQSREERSACSKEAPPTSARVGHPPPAARASELRPGAGGG